jgi:D-beta-D-heptose 7-phosphate kinase/D-beta-D-heptose 1-phosphate adenosyltransferase
MRIGNSIHQKISNLDDLKRRVAVWRMLGKKIAFTNGCFDILHAGHISSFMEAAGLADVLIIGLNADVSVRKLKGTNRPVNSESDRALLLASLSMVDAVILFSEDTPQQLIAALLPDILVKGGDYRVEDIAGAKEVIAAGGRVVINPILPGHSTSGIIEKIQKKV